MIKNFIKQRLQPSQRLKLRAYLNNFKAFFVSDDLNKLGKIYGTDKSGGHSYTVHYMTHFKKFKRKKINLLEIGVGGYDNPLYGGNSLRMWKKYFSFGHIFSFDIHDKSAHEEKRIKIFKGGQTDVKFLNKLCSDIGDLDIVIDDGSHVNSHVIQTFNILFPKLKDGGIYVIEDTQTSYWSSFGGDSKILENPKTISNYFKGFINGLNHMEFVIKNYQPSYFDKNIVSMHFYHNLIFIYKGSNDEPSNCLVNNQWP